MVSNTRLTLNLQYPNIAQVAYAMQGDRLSRAVVADLIDGSTPWAPPAGAYGLITASKPDGTFAVYDTLEDGSPAIVIDGSTVTLYLAEQVLADAGAVKMSVAFFTAAGARLTTFRWTEVVAPEAVLDRVVSGDYISILTAAMAEAAEIFQQIKAAYGAPLTANTAAAMTDTSRVYVYTGTTGGGFTNGHWYYWNGSAWTDGGVYNATAFETDTTLSVAGMAADARVVGDRIKGYDFTAPFDIMSKSTAVSSEGAVVYTRVNNNTWDISGATTSSNSFKNLISNYPVVPGDVYEFRITGGIGLRLYLTVNGTDKTINYTSDGTYRLLAPDGATEMDFRWQIAANTTIPSGTRATIYVLHYTADSYKSYSLLHNGLDVVRSDAWQFGGNTATSGKITTSTTEIYVWQNTVNGNVVWLDIADGYSGVICCYDNDGTYLGTYRNGYFENATGGELVKRFYTGQLPSGLFRIHVRKTAGGTITKEEGQTAVAFYCIPDSSQGADSGTLESTGDETDRTAEVQALLSTNGICKFGKGKYYVKNVQMPDNTKVCGQGAKTEIVLIDSGLNYENLWAYGDQSFTRSYSQDVSLPAGDYSVSADITTTDTDVSNCAIVFYYRSPYTASNGKYVYFGRGIGENATFTAAEPVVHIELYAGNTYSNSAGDSATYQNVSLVKVEKASAFILGSNCEVADMTILGAEDSITLRKADYMRYGVLHEGIGTDSNIGKSNIHDCWFKSFNGACICLNNSGYSAHNGLNISGCYMNESRAGVDIQRLSEFHRVINCSITGNYYGIINNGGNNEFVGCNLSANSIGFAIDNITGLKTNNSHGGVSGCIMQHNRIRAVYINHGGAGFVFTGCNIDNGGIEIINACRIIFSGCNFMSDLPMIISGVYEPNTSMIMFIACNMRISENNTYTITAGAIAKFINCYTADGTLVDPTVT